MTSVWKNAEQGARIIGLVKTSGATVLFSASDPGRIVGNAVVGTARGGAWEHVEVRKPVSVVRKRSNGSVYEIVDRDGRTYPVGSVATEVESATGQAQNGEVEDYPIPENTLPVSLAWVEVSGNDSSLSVRFMTADERLNAGFNVWGLTGDSQRTLLARVPSADGDSSAPQSYQVRVAAPRVRSVLLEDLSVDGRSRLHGPFPVGGSYGERPEADPIDWDRVRRETGVAGFPRSWGTKTLWPLNSEESVCHS